MPLLTRRKFVRVTDIAEQYSISKFQVYKLINLPVFADAVFRVGRSNNDRSGQVLRNK